MRFSSLFSNDYWAPPEATLATRTGKVFTDDMSGYGEPAGQIEIAALRS